MDLTPEEHAQILEVSEDFSTTYSSYRKSAVIGKGHTAKVYRAKKVNDGISIPHLRSSNSQIVALKEMSLSNSKKHVYGSRRD
jgi:hypothetical protein